ncbi:MAG: glycosyltransferase family 4 protein [Limisphaerales bacterium]
MKLLVFAHTPPPHHGQSYMVKLMLDGFGGDCRKNGKGHGNEFGIDCYHINARFSKSLEDVGEFQSWKMILVFLYCLQAVWCRFRYGVKNFYYVPAPGKSVAVYRDWLVMFICRAFFENVILHWHAAGLAKWLETSVQIRSRATTYHLFKPVTLSIVLSNYNLADAEKLMSRLIRNVNYGIPDPCPDFEQSVLPRRRARFDLRKRLLAASNFMPPEYAENALHTVNVLYLAHYMREKGLFAAAAAVVLANQILQQKNLPVRLKLLAAGAFATEQEKAEFQRLQENPEFATAVQLLGFVSGPTKEKALREADLFCFPTQYLAENQPVTLIEAMACGLPIVTTRWRSLPEMLPPGYPGLVSTQSPDEIAGALLKIAQAENGENLRQHFLENFTLQTHLTRLAEALHAVEL